MSTVPASTDTIANLPPLLLRTYSDDIGDDLVAGDAREKVAEEAAADGFIAVADTAGDYFDEQLALLGLLDLDVLEDEVFAGLFGD